jgi:hypothetical protein
MLIDFLTSFGSLPGTIGVAIIIFLLRELFEIRRKRGERSRKLDAIKNLISDELEKNHWALISMFRVINVINDLNNNFPNSKIRLHVARNGSEHFRFKKEQGEPYESGQSIPRYSIEMYQKLITTIAELDNKIYEKIKIAYDEIVELIHYRGTLIDYLAGEELHDREMTSHFLMNYADEQKDYFKILNECYKYLTGTELKSWRLR